MLIIDETYFRAEIRIPQLPVSMTGENPAYYGMAMAIQTTGQNELYDFINDKVTEYLYKAFGRELSNDLINQYINWKENKDPYSVTIAEITEEIPINEWIESEVTSDIVFGDISIEGCEKVSDVRIGEKREIVFKQLPDYTFYDFNFNVKVDVDFYGKVSYKIDSDRTEIPLGTVITIVDLRDKTEPEERFRELIKRLRPFHGKVNKSPLANYVYFWLNRDAYNFSTVTGEADLNFARASSAYETDKHIKQNTQRNKLVRAWNDMCALNIQLFTWLYMKPYLFKDYRIPIENHKNLIRTINTFNI